jgi:hypothetical protein
MARSSNFEVDFYKIFSRFLFLLWSKYSPQCTVLRHSPVSGSYYPVIPRTKFHFHAKDGRTCSAVYFNLYDFSYGWDEREETALLEITPFLTFVTENEDFRLLRHNAVQSDESDPMFRRNLFGGPDGVIPQETEISSVRAVKGSYPISDR